MVPIDVWSDFVCPWCYLGKRRLERALSTLPEDAVEVRWHAFQLDPDTPRFGSPGAGELTDRYLEEKFGDPERVRQMQEHLTRLAAADGLDYHLDLSRRANTLDAHRLAEEATIHGRSEQLAEALFRAQFVEGRRIDDPATLTELGVESGLPSERVAAVLAGDAHLDAVADDIRTARELGVNGVPFFVFDRRLGVSGAQPVETLVAALAQARGSSEPRVA